MFKLGDTVRVRDIQMNRDHYRLKNHIGQLMKIHAITTSGKDTILSLSGDLSYAGSFLADRFDFVNSQDENGIETVTVTTTHYKTEDGKTFAFTQEGYREALNNNKETRIEKILVQIAPVGVITKSSLKDLIYTNRKLIRELLQLMDGWK